MATVQALLDQFEAGAVADGVPNSVYDELLELAPPSERAAPLLLDLVFRASDQGLFAVATLAVALASDPGYRPVVQRILDERPVARTWHHSFYQEARSSPAGSVTWWFDMLAERKDRDPFIDFSLTMLIRERIAELWDARRTQTLDHLLLRDRGPGHWVVEAVEAVLVQGGPNADLEAMFARWIDDGRFDGTYDQPDGSTSIIFMAGPLERCVEKGPFDHSWPLLARAVAHLRNLLDDGDEARRTVGLRNIARLIDGGHTLVGHLPSGILPVLDKSSAAARAIASGFTAVMDLERRPDSEWSEQQRHESCQVLHELADDRPTFTYDPWDGAS